MIRLKIDTPLKSIRKHCLYCCRESSQEVRFCPGNESKPVCPLWPLRLGKKAQGVKTLKAIRARCLDCSAYNRADVKGCQYKNCPLYPYRMGKNPNLKGKGRSAEEMALISAKHRAEGLNVL